MTPEENARINQEEIDSCQVKLRSMPIQFNIDLTGQCNINPPCVFCSQKYDGYKYAARDISYVDKYLNFMEHCTTVTDCSFGEPLTHPAFIKIMQRVTGNGQAFTFATNGLLLNKEKADLIVNASSNIGFSASLNAATPETYFKMTGQKFETVINNLQYYIKGYRDKWGHFPPLAFNFIVMRINKEEVLAFLRLAKSLGVGAVNLRHLFPTAGSPQIRNDFGYKFIYDEEMLSANEYAQISKESKITAEQLGLLLRILWEPGGQELIPKKGIPCLYPWHFLLIQEHTQNVYLCCYSDCAIGNVAKMKLEDIWNGPEIVSIRKNLIAGELPAFCREHGVSCPLIARK